MSCCLLMEVNFEAFEIIPSVRLKRFENRIADACTIHQRGASSSHSLDVNDRVSPWLLEGTSRAFLVAGGDQEELRPWR
jgi:hypothetical protein